MGDNHGLTHVSDTAVPSVLEGSNGVLGGGVYGRAKLSSQVASVIMALGAVLNTTLFIYLSFKYPSASNLIIPLILKPVLDFLAERWRERKNVRSIE